MRILSRFQNASLVRQRAAACMARACRDTMLMCIASALSCLAQQDHAGRDPFSDVVVQNRFFKKSDPAPAIDVRLKERAKVACVAYDIENRPVAWKLADEAATETRIVLDQLPPVAKGVYLFCLVATDPDGRRLGYYPHSPGGREIIHVRDSQVDAEKRLISYMLPRAASVRLRAGFRDGPYLQPIIMGEAQPAGRYTVPWDGASGDGLFTNLYAHPAIQVNALARSLPVNVLVAHDQTRDTPTAGTAATFPLPTALTGLSEPPWLKAPGEPQGSFLIAEDYGLAITVREDAVQRLANIRVDLQSTDRARLLNRRFELMLFVDALFVAEDERSQLPFSYRMSTRGLAPGKHVVTVNVVDSESSLGTASAELLIAKP